MKLITEIKLSDKDIVDIINGNPLKLKIDKQRIIISSIMLDYHFLIKRIKEIQLKELPDDNP